MASSIDAPASSLFVYAVDDAVVSIACEAICTSALATGPMTPSGERGSSARESRALPARSASTYASEGTFGSTGSEAVGVAISASVGVTDAAERSAVEADKAARSIDFETERASNSLSSSTSTSESSADESFALSSTSATAKRARNADLGMVCSTAPGSAWERIDIIGWNSARGPWSGTDTVHPRRTKKAGARAKQQEPTDLCMKPHCNTATFGAHEVPGHSCSAET